MLLILKEQFCPHIFVQARHTSKIAETAGTITPVELCRGALDEGIGNHVAHLRGVGNHAVMEIGSRNNILLEAQWTERLLHTVEQRNVIVYRRHHYE